MEKFVFFKRTILHNTQLRQICNLMQTIIRISYPEYNNEDEKYSHLQYVIAIMTFAQRYFNALKA